MTPSTAPARTTLSSATSGFYRCMIPIDALP